MRPFLGLSKTIFLLLLLGLLCPNFAAAKFGSNGIVTITYVSNHTHYQLCTSLVLRPNGKLVVAGIFQDHISFEVAQYNNNGSLDDNFGTNGIVVTNGSAEGLVADIILQPDGKLVAVAENSIWRYTVGGSLDATFGLSGTTATSYGLYFNGFGIATRQDGKIIVAGGVHPASVWDFALVRYNSNGDLDPSFGSEGVVTTPVGTGGIARSLIQQPDGKLVAAGWSTVSGNINFALVRYNSNGTLDSGFGGTGKVTTAIGSGTSDYAYCLVLQPDGKLVAAGQSGGLALARYDRFGYIDTNFGTNGKVTNTNLGKIYDLVQQPDGRFVAVMRGSSDFQMARFNNNGSLDTNFGTGGVALISLDTGGGIADDAASIILQPDGKLVVAGTSMHTLVAARCNSDGSLDTQDDPPLMLETTPNHALAGQTVTLNIHGWNLDDVVGVQLRNSGGSVNGSGLNVMDSTHLSAQVTLPSTPGLYDLYLTKNILNRTFKGTFVVQSPVGQPAQWQTPVDLGKAGNPINGACGLAIGDANRDGASELYVANHDHQLYMYKKGAAWTVTVTPFAAESSYFQDVVLADMDLDGNAEVYGANAFPMTYQYQWSGSDWNRNTFCAYSGPLSKGWMAGGGLSELYALSGSALAQSQLFNQAWLNRQVSAVGGAMICSVVGDANNDQVNRVYAANTDHKVYQLQYQTAGTSWSLTTTAFTGTADMTCLAIGDLDRNGANELYGSNLDGNIYQMKWNGTWTSTPITSGLVANKIVINDGDNSGQDSLYAAGQDHHAYQLKWSSGSWHKTDLGDAGTPLIALAVGDGDNSHQHKVYAVGSNNHVYQFQAVGPPVTPTPTPEPTIGPNGVPDTDRRLRAYHNQINPLRNEQTRIQWYQFADNPVRIRVFNLLGDKVADLSLAGAYAAGHLYSTYWNGRTNSGAAVGSGIYVVYIESGNYSEYTKVAVVK